MWANAPCFAYLPLQILDPYNHSVDALDPIFLVYPSAIPRPFHEVISHRLYSGEILFYLSLGRPEDLPVVLERNLPPYKWMRVLKETKHISLTRAKGCSKSITPSVFTLDELAALDMVSA